MEQVTKTAGPLETGTAKADRLLDEAVDRLIASRKAQGLPPTVENPGVLAKIATILWYADAGRRQAIQEEDKRLGDKKKAQQEKARAYAQRPEVKDKVLDYTQNKSKTALKKKELWVQQKGLCGVCSGPLDSILSSHLDHNHAHCLQERGCDQCVRGLLHPRCNIVLGQHEVSPNLVAQFDAYLAKYPNQSSE